MRHLPLYWSITSPLPKLDICQESPERRLPVVVVELLDLLGAESPSAGDEISSCWVAPWSSEDDLVADSEEDDDEETERVLEEVLSRESKTALDVKLVWIHGS